MIISIIMQTGSFESETRAYAAFMKWIEDAKEVRDLFESCRLPIPAPLARSMNIVPTTTNNERRGTLIPPAPDAPDRPQEAQHDWIWVKAKDLVETTLVLAVLRQASSTLSFRELVERVTKFKPDLNSGSVSNIGTRLGKTKSIERGDDGWKLIDKSAAPILTTGREVYAWGPTSIFQKQDLAQHRRVLIEHLLKASPKGLMNLQIVEQLSEADYCRAPATKDLVKGDLLAMSEQGKVKRVGNTRKYRLAEDKS